MKPGKYIFVGKPGSGKGAGYAFFPKPHFVADTDGKIDNLKYLYRGLVKLKEISSYNEFDNDNLKEIQYISYPGPKSYDSMYIDFKNALENPPVRADGSPGTWTMDSLTTLAGNTINYGLSQRGGGGKSMGRVPIPDLPEWLGESMFLSSLFIDAKDLPCHVILLGHWTVVERDIMVGKEEKARGAPGGTRTKITKQMITGGTKIGVAIPTYFNEVYNFQCLPPYEYGESPIYKVFTGPTEEVEIGRSRMRPELPYEIDLTYDHASGNPPVSLFAYIDAAMKLIDESGREVNEKGEGETNAEQEV